MTTPVWVEFICHVCGDTTCGRFIGSGHLNVSKMKADAKERGWRFSHDQCFCSEKCLLQHRSNELNGIQNR